MYWGVWGDISDIIAGEGAPGGELINPAEGRNVIHFQKC